MTKKELTQALKDLGGLRPNTASFFVDESGNEQSDGSFTCCELCGVKNTCFGVTMLDKKDNIVFIEICEQHIGGHLGKLAGAF